MRDSNFNRMARLAQSVAEWFENEHGKKVVAEVDDILETQDYKFKSLDLDNALGLAGLIVSVAQLVLMIKEGKTGPSAKSKTEIKQSVISRYKYIQSGDTTIIESITEKTIEYTFDERRGT